MKPAFVSTAAFVLAVAATPALAQNRADVEIEHAVARVAVVVEDRADVGVEIEQGGTALPRLQIQRDGRRVRIDGGLARRVGTSMVNNSIQNCRNGDTGSGDPGQNAVVEVRDIGRINVREAPLIVLRVPRDFEIDGSGALFGSIGRGARSVKLGNAGCGHWNVANTDGDLSLAIGGSGDIRAGTSSSLNVSIGGSGSVVAGATGELEVSIGGSGDVNVASTRGETEISIGGSGDVVVRDGSAPELSISIAGSGDVDFRGTAGDVDVSMVGGGDVRVARATGQVRRSIMGGGNVRIGQ